MTSRVIRYLCLLVYMDAFFPILPSRHIIPYNRDVRFEVALSVIETVLRC